jgi:hypothetical protein
MYEQNASGLVKRFASLCNAHTVLLCPTEKRAIAWIQKPVCRKGEKGPGQSSPSTKSQLEPSRDGETMRRGKEESIQDVMKEDQRPTE